MMIRKDKIAMLGMFAAMALMGDKTYLEQGGYKELTEEGKAEFREAVDRKINKNNGLTEFEYEGGKVWALNQKNADRKAKKKGYI